MTDPAKGPSFFGASPVAIARAHRNQFLDAAEDAIAENTWLQARVAELEAELAARGPAAAAARGSGVICPTCEVAGLTSTATSTGGGVSTAVATLTEAAEDGTVRHVDPNSHTDSWRCSNGHDFRRIREASGTTFVPQV